MVKAFTGNSEKDGHIPQKRLNEESSRQIISSLTHELRTPLSIISSNLQLLQDSKMMDDEMREETFELCGEAIKSMSRFLDDIYFLNVSIKGELKRIPEVFELNTFFNKLVKEFSFLEYEDKRLFLIFFLEENEIYTDKELLNRSLHNVISNAMKFSPEEVQVNVAFDGKLLKVDIVDKGIGIPRDDLELIFDPFFRGENVKMIAGTGLGLSIVRKSIDCLGGEIKIESEVGEGTNVKLIIPNDGR